MDYINKPLVVRHTKRSPFPGPLFGRATSIRSGIVPAASNHPSLLLVLSMYQTRGLSHISITSPLRYNNCESISEDLLRCSSPIWSIIFLKRIIPDSIPCPAQWAASTIVGLCDNNTVTWKIPRIYELSHYNNILLIAPKRVTINGNLWNNSHVLIGKREFIGASSLQSLFARR